MKCSSCGLSNFGNAETCRRCGSTALSKSEPMVRCSHCGLKRPADHGPCPFCDGGAGGTFRGFGPAADDGNHGPYPKEWRGGVTLILGSIVLLGSGIVVWMWSHAGGGIILVPTFGFLAGAGLVVRGLMGQEPPGWK